MINKRKLDEVIGYATYKPEKLCGYTFEECLSNPRYQEHVCGFVRDCLMPDILANYLYQDCYYDDIETIKANLNYINLAIKKHYYYKKWWIDISLEAVLEAIEQQKEYDAKRTESSTDGHFDCIPGP